MYQGPSELVLDSKGRLVVPTRHRPALLAECEGKLTLTLDPDGCLLLYPRPAWEAFRSRVMGLKGKGRQARRFFLGRAVDVEMDSAGRVLISPELCKAGRLEREKPVMLLGMGSYFEIWDAAVHEAQESAAMSGGDLDDLLEDLEF